jgi:general secretion pathway protein M
VIRQYWGTLNERERLLLGLGSVCLILYFFYSFIYSALDEAVTQKTQALQEKKKTLIWMQQVSQKTKSNKMPSSITNNRLLTVIATQLKSKDLKTFPYQLEQTGQGDIQLTFEVVPYILILQWLWKLQTDYALTLKQFTAEKTNTPGVVKVLIILSAI